MLVLTGGAGFIGSAFLSYLNAKGVDDVLVVDALGSSEKWKNLAGKRFSDYVHKNEFLERIRANSLPADVSAIVHLGACSSTTERDAEYMLRNNYQYSKILAEWAWQRRVPFYYASSAATYGDGALGFSDEDARTPDLRPLNVYAFSKQLFDEWLLRKGMASHVVGWKFFNVFGPNEYHKAEMRSVVLKAFEQIRSTGRVQLFKSAHPDYGDGEQRRDFIYVKDCCELMWKFLERPEISGIYNIGTGSSRTWKDLVSAVFAALDLQPAIDYIEMPEPLRAKYQYFTEADTKKLAAALPGAQTRPLEDSVRDYVQNYLSGSKTL